MDDDFIRKKERQIQFVGIALTLFFFCKVYFPELLRTVFVLQHRIAKLLACQVKNTVTDNVETMIVPVFQGNTIYLTAKQILCQKCRN